MSSSTLGTAIAVLGAKGGVGTTTIAANLAAQLHVDGAGEVLLIDLHLFLGDVGFRLGVEGEPTVMQFIKGGTTSNSDTIRRHPFGFSVLGLSADLTDADDVRADEVVALLDHLRTRFDRIVIDCGANLNEASLAACRYADHRLLIVTEQRPALIGAKRRLDVLLRLGIPGTTALGIINRAHPDSGVEPAQIERAVGLPIVVRIRNAWQDNQTALAQNKLLLESCPDAGVTTDYPKIIRHMQ